MEAKLIDELCIDREWRFSELEFCKKVPKFYANALFAKNTSKYWRMCIPIIYAHWEGFVVSAYQQLILYLNKKNLKYSQVKQFLVILSNKHRFEYLKGNPTKEQKKRFLDEYNLEETVGIDMPLTLISAKSNLNYKRFLAILDEFNIVPTLAHNKNKSTIEKLVTYRNKIAHGENSVIVYETDINIMIGCVMEMIDTTISDIERYVFDKPFML